MPLRIGQEIQEVLRGACLIRRKIVESRLFEMSLAEDICVISSARLFVFRRA